MWDYSQPDFYRFNEDSTQFASYIIENCNLKKETKILDSFCGSGIIGLELISRLKNVESKIDLTFCEIENEYKKHLCENIKYIVKELKLINISTSVIINDFFHTNLDQFDLIVSNPPYFNKNKHRESPDKKRNTARFFSIEEFHTFIVKSLSLLREDGEFLFLLKDQSFKDLLEAEFEGCYLSFALKDHTQVIHFKKVNL